MLRIRPPGPDEDKWPGDWLMLTKAFFSSLREAIADKALDTEAVQRALDAWQRTPVALGEDRLPFAETMSRMRAMLWCADHAQKTVPLSDGAPPVLTELTADAPPEACDRADWSLACIRIFRGEPSPKRIAVPIALADELIQLKGGIATLVFDIYTPGNGRLTLNPEETFRVLPDDDFTESLSTAWRIAREVAKNEDGQSEFPDVVWRAIRESPSMSGLDEKAFFQSAGLRLERRITGRSASGAAARAFRHLLKGTDPDPDVFVLAQVREDARPTDQLEGVGGVTAKVEAIADAGLSATIIVMENDKAEADLTVARKKATSRIDIDVDMPPVVRKLLAGAETLTDDDRFGAAIPLLEEALKEATEAKRPSAEAKIHIRLGHALFEGKEDFARAAEHFRKALELVGESPSPVRRSALHNFGDMLLWAGRMDEAGAAIHASLEVSRSLGKPHEVGQSLISLALLERALGNAQAAKSHLNEATRLFNQVSLTLRGDKRKKNVEALTVCYGNQAELELDEGRLEGALALYAKVEALHRDSGGKLNVGKIHFRTGELCLENNDVEQAFRCFERAWRVFLDLNNHLWTARAWKALARVCAKKESWWEALGATSNAIDAFELAGSTDEHTTALLLAATLTAKFHEWELRMSVVQQIHEIAKKVPKDKYCVNEVLCILQLGVFGKGLRLRGT